MKKKTVRELRLSKNWTQEKLGDKLGISNKTVSAKELGVRHFTNKELAKIAKYFKTDLKLIKSV